MPKPSHFKSAKCCAGCRYRVANSCNLYNFILKNLGGGVFEQDTKVCGDWEGF